MFMKILKKSVSVSCFFLLFLVSLFFSSLSSSQLLNSTNCKHTYTKRKPTKYFFSTYFFESSQLKCVIDETDFELFVKVKATQIKRDLVTAWHSRRVRARTASNRVGRFVDVELEHKRLLNIEFRNRQLNTKIKVVIILYEYFLKKK